MQEAPFGYLSGIILFTDTAIIFEEMFKMKNKKICIFCFSWEYLFKVMSDYNFKNFGIMESISIKKFDFGRSYLTSGSKSMLFNLVERVGKELTFDVLSGKKEVMKVKGTAKVVLENGVAQEVVRIDVFDAFFTLKATVSKRVVEKKNVASEKEDDEDTSGNVVPLEQEKLLHVI